MSIKTHIDNWISKAEPDYYTMFIKAWIPFNAWYFAEYSTKQDKDALDKIKGSKNKVRNRIEALLLNNDIDSKHFRFHLGELHSELEKRGIMNYGKLLTFKAIVIEGVLPKPATDKDKKGNIYKAIPNKMTGYRAVILDKTNKTLMDKTFNPYNYDTFLTDTQYVSIADSKVKEKIRLCFASINPDNATNLISTSKVKSDYLQLDPVVKVKFINNTELIAKGLIQILYALRCILFHGELDPTEINNAVYEHAFHILKPIIKELK